MPSKLNPKQLFVINTISRSDIARGLNKVGGGREFKPGDPRLTDKVCRAIANDVGSMEAVEGAEDYEQSDYDDELDDIYCDWRHKLTKIG